MSSNITNFKNIINQNFATIKRKFNNIENNYNSSTSPTTSNNQSISRNVGEIITSSLPLTDAGLHLLDGSLIQGDGINSEFVDYIANIYKTKDRVYNSSAFTVFGNPTITTDGIASGFSTSNYLTIPTITIDNKDFEFYVKIKTPAMSSTQDIFGGSTPDHRFIFGWSSQKKFYSSTSGDFSFPVLYTASTLEYDTEYYIKTGVKNNIHYLSYSIDGVNWITRQQNITNQFTNLTNMAIGNRKTNNPYYGTIDLKQFSITIDGVEVFNGSTPANYFIDETEWQQSVTQYGVCGKFVYDSTLNTVRLPKITGILEGTTDISALGDLVEAGLPNITSGTDWLNSTAGTLTEAINGTPSLDGCFDAVSRGGHGINSNEYPISWSRIDASRSSSIYGNSSTVQPQTIKCFVYIVIANSTKTDIQVDIDEIATDLNDKADTDLANTTPTASFATTLNNAEIRTVVETYVNGASWYRVYSDGWCEQGGRCESSGASYGQTTLLKPYKNTNYIVLFSFNTTLGCRDDMFSVSYVQAYNKTASSFYSYRADSNSDLSTMWRACGYV